MLFKPIPQKVLLEKLSQLCHPVVSWKRTTDKLLQMIPIKSHFLNELPLSTFKIVFIDNRIFFFVIRSVISTRSHADLVLINLSEQNKFKLGICQRILINGVDVFMIQFLPYNVVNLEFGSLDTEFICVSKSLSRGINLTFLWSSPPLKCCNFYYLLTSTTLPAS